MPHYEFFWPSILHGTREQRRGRSFRQALHQPNGWDVRGPSARRGRDSTGWQSLQAKKLIPQTAPRFLTMFIEAYFECGLRWRTVFRWPQVARNAGVVFGQ